MHKNLPLDGGLADSFLSLCSAFPVSVGPGLSYQRARHRTGKRKTSACWGPISMSPMFTWPRDSFVWPSRRNKRAWSNRVGFFSSLSPNACPFLFMGETVYSATLGLETVSEKLEDKPGDEERTRPAEEGWWMSSYICLFYECLTVTDDPHRAPRHLVLHRHPRAAMAGGRACRTLFVLAIGLDFERDSGISSKLNLLFGG